MKPFNSNLSSEQISNTLIDFKKIIDTGSFILGEFNSQFENKCATITNNKYSVAVSSGTVALECIFQYLYDEKSVRKVGVQSNTNFATVSAIVHSGAEVVFIDCDLDGQLDNFEAIKLIEKNKVDCIAPVHIGGLVSKSFSKLVQKAADNHVILIEDCAHAHGTIMDGRRAGSFGFASILSFFPTKLVNASEGGAICTNCSQFADYARMWRNQGKSGTFGNDHAVLGGSYRLSEFNARLGLESFKNLDSEIKTRMYFASILNDGLLNSSVRISSFSHLESFSCYKLICSIENTSGAEIESKLKEHSIYCGGAVYRKGCHMQPVFADIKAPRLPNTEKFCYEHFCVPLHSGLSESDIQRLLSVLLICNN
jgi:perosamine synthetase